MDIICTIHASPVRTNSSITNTISSWRKKYLFIIFITPSIKPKRLSVKFFLHFYDSHRIIKLFLKVFLRAGLKDPALIIKAS